MIENIPPQFAVSTNLRLSEDLAMRDREDKESLLKDIVQKHVSDGRDYFVDVTLWKERCIGNIVVDLVKEVRIFLKNFDEAEFIGDIVLTSSPSSRSTCVLPDGKMFDAINSNNTIWKLVNGKKDLRQALITSTTKFNPNLHQIKLAKPLTLNDGYFVTEVHKAAILIETETYGLHFPNTLWLSRRDYAYASTNIFVQQTLTWEPLLVKQYLERNWFCPFSIASKDQLKNVAVLFCDDRFNYPDRRRDSGTTKHADRTTWLFAENSDELLYPKSVAVLTWEDAIA